MRTRIELHNQLKTLLGSDNVYYQPPENIKIQYPAIIYAKKNIDVINANDSIYYKNIDYSITVLDTRPDNKVIDKILSLNNARFERHYFMNSLNHDVINITIRNGE